MQKDLESVLKKAPVVPVLVIDALENAVPLAKALMAGSLPVLEITLRTKAAADCIRAIKAEVEGCVIGSGTVLDRDQLALSEKLGCAFAVSPGSSPKLLAAAKDHAIPLLPGAASASESMTLLEEGYVFQKFFPAEPAGGAAYLASLHSPLPQISFCPTGGITPEKAPSYLKLANVITVGGSWMAPKAKIAAGDWAGITALAKECAKLRG